MDEAEPPIDGDQPRCDAGDVICQNAQSFLKILQNLVDQLVGNRLRHETRTVVICGPASVQQSMGFDNAVGSL
jgi:hypothetical protein